LGVYFIFGIYLTLKLLKYWNNNELSLLVHLKERCQPLSSYREQPMFSFFETWPNCSKLKLNKSETIIFSYVKIIFSSFLFLLFQVNPVIIQWVITRGKAVNYKRSFQTLGKPNNMIVLSVVNQGLYFAYFRGVVVAGHAKAYVW
jgi:hypothetical protein